MTTYIKDSAAVLDYMFDWSDDLDDGETIVDAEVTVAGGGLVKDSQLVTDGTNRAGETVTSAAVVVWLSDGDTGDEGTATCQITTSAGRIDERTMTIKVRER